MKKFIILAFSIVLTSCVIKGPKTVYKVNRGNVKSKVLDYSEWKSIKDSIFTKVTFKIADSNRIAIKLRYVKSNGYKVGSSLIKVKNNSNNEKSFIQIKDFKSLSDKFRIIKKEESEFNFKYFPNFKTKKFTKIQNDGELLSNKADTIIKTSDLIELIRISLPIPNSQEIVLKFSGWNYIE